jgi:hypothetical protein
MLEQRHCMQKKGTHKQRRCYKTRKWVTFTYYSPTITKVTNLFKNAGLRIAFRSSNKVFRLLNKKQHEGKYKNSGVYRLIFNTSKKAYVAQMGRCLRAHFNEHIRYIRTNNPKSVYAMHIMNNRHEYGPINSTTDLLKHCEKGKN